MYSTTTLRRASLVISCTQHIEQVRPQSSYTTAVEATQTAQTYMLKTSLFNFTGLYGCLQNFYLIERFLNLVEVIEIVLHRHTDGIHSMRARQPLPGQQFVQVTLENAMREQFVISI